MCLLYFDGCFSVDISKFSLKFQFKKDIDLDKFSGFEILNCRKNISVKIESLCSLVL